jgi:hypothetical protein
MARTGPTQPTHARAPARPESLDGVEHRHRPRNPVRFRTESFTQLVAGSAIDCHSGKPEERGARTPTLARPRTSRAGYSFVVGLRPDGLYGFAPRSLAICSRYVGDNAGPQFFVQLPLVSGQRSSCRTPASLPRGAFLPEPSREAATNRHALWKSVALGRIALDLVTLPPYVQRSSRTLAYNRSHDRRDPKRSHKLPHPAQPQS